MIDFVGKKRWFFLASAIVLLVGIVCLSVFGLKPGTDFIGGTAITFHFSQPVEQGELRQEMANLGYDDAMIQNAGEGYFIVHLGQILSAEAEELAEALGEDLGCEAMVEDYYLASPTVGIETARNAGIAIAVAAVAMLLYIVWAFRRMPKPFRWGTCAIIALIHDVLVVLTIFAILGWLADIEVDAMFITGLLAVVGYSINNTVVIFDRIRENRLKDLNTDFEVTVNSSIVETLGRSLNTSLTTLFVILALLLFGGVTIRFFVLVLLIGVIAGTYSSLCISSQLLVVWEKRQWGQLFSWLPFVKRPA